MNVQNVIHTLANCYAKEGHRIVFWHDPDEEFCEDIQELLPAGVVLIRTDLEPALGVKARLELEEPEQRFLLYSAESEPPAEQDWYLDIRLYARTFRADRASLLLDELGLERGSLRAHLHERRAFLANKERVARLAQLTQPQDDEESLDRKMLAVLLRTEQHDFLSLVHALYHSTAELNLGQQVELDTPPAVWENAQKYGLDDRFWELADRYFGYREENPSFRNLLIRLFVTDFTYHVQGSAPDSISHLTLPATGVNNAVACLAQWRDSSSRASSYDLLAESVEAFLNVTPDDRRLVRDIHEFEIEQLQRVFTFLAVEQAIASKLRDRIMDLQGACDLDKLRDIVGQRKGGHWVSQNFHTEDSRVPREALAASYDALLDAAHLMVLAERELGSLPADADALYHAYEDSIYRFDSLYRRFCERADWAEGKGWNLLKSLRESVDDVYTNTYLPELAIAWDNAIGGTLTETWRLPDRANQFQFYERHVQPYIAQGDRKAFVIISDAFRYEAAMELTQDLNRTYRLEAEITSMLGVVPSYTALGMTALLPHRKLTFSEKSKQWMADDRPAASIDQRNAILADEGGIAVRAPDLLQMTKEQGRERTKGAQVVYVYHNMVDAIGDDAGSEHMTFKSVRSAIDDLFNLIKHLIDSLNANHVVLTADHGFLFQERSLQEVDRSKLGDKPETAILTKKRFILGYNLPERSSVWTLNLDTASGLSDSQGMNAWLPKGNARFHFAGGAQYVHGGIMPQEIVVPVVTIKHRKTEKARKETQTRPVRVQVLGSGHKITTSRHRFELLQVEPVGDRYTPLTIKIAVYDGDKPVTDIQTVTLDSDSERLSDRQQWVTLVLTQQQYDRKKTYHLVLRNAETSQEAGRMTVTIDRAFVDDF